MDEVTRLYIGIDGGNSKTDVAVADADGGILGIYRGPGSSPDKLGLEAAVVSLSEQVHAGLGQLNLDGTHVSSVVAMLAGLDLPEETRDFERAFSQKLAPLRVRVHNDAVAPLMAGTRGAPGVAVVCGAGFNAVAVGQDGQTHSFLSLGQVSGDWGGGISLGREVLWHAARAEDGRGRKTDLLDVALRHFSCGSISQLSQAVHRGLFRESELAEMTPALFLAAEGGDEVASGLVSRLAEEVAVSVSALVDRAGLRAMPIPVILSGSLFIGGGPTFLGEVRTAVHALVRDVQLRVLDRRPVAGSLIAAGLMEETADGYDFAERILSDPAVMLSKR